MKIVPFDRELDSVSNTSYGANPDKKKLEYGANFTDVNFADKLFVAY